MKTNLIQRIGLAGCMFAGSLGFGGCSEVLLDIASKQSNPRKANSAYGLARMARDLERHEMNKEVAREGKSEVNVGVGGREEEQYKKIIKNYEDLIKIYKKQAELRGKQWAIEKEEIIKKLKKECQRISKESIIEVYLKAYESGYRNGAEKNGNEDYLGKILEELKER